jgi:hypothetical protein
MIDLPSGSGAAFARVELQGAHAGGAYRLEILRPGTPLTEEMEPLAPPPSGRSLRGLDRRLLGTARPGL